MSKKIVMKGLVLSTILSSMLYANTTESLDDVIVTANKLEENILDIPQSITVIDKEELSEKNIDSVTKIIDEIPSMSSSTILGIGTLTNFRGLNTSLFNIFSSPIVFYVDGIPTMNRYTYETSLVNAKRVEVLSGPQGTLYGKDSIGAVINIITEDTPDKLTGYVGTEYGTDNYSKTTFNISTPLIKDKLYAGINGQYKRSDGFVTNHFNNDDKSAKSWSYDLNSYLKYLPSDNLSLKFVVNKSKSKKNGADSATYTTSLSSLSQSKADDTKNANYEIPTREKIDTDSQSFALKYNFQEFDLDWVVSRKNSDFDGNYDYDFTVGNTFDNTSQYNKFNAKSYSNELRLSGNKDDFKWVFGVYSDYDKYEESTGYDNFPTYGKYDGSGEMTGKTNAVFGQIVIPVYKSLELTLGGRYQRIKKDTDIDVSIEDSPASNYSFKNKKTWNTFLPKIALSYKANENITPYVTISKGYMPGGFNTFPASTNKDNNTYDPQESINYELGIKGIYDDFEFSSSVFYMDIEDLQVYRVNGNFWNLRNADKAHSYGLEVAGKYYLTQNFDLSGNVSLIKAVYDDYMTGNKRFDGEDIENTPSHKVNLTLSYHGESGLYGLFTVYNRGSIRFYDNAAIKFLEESSATTASIKIGHKFSNLDIYAYVDNITDERYVNGYYSKGTLTTVSYNTPRFFGIGIKYNF